MTTSNMDAPMEKEEARRNAVYLINDKFGSDVKSLHSVKDLYEITKDEIKKLEGQVLG